MMTQKARRRKSISMRGSRTHGYGSHKKHRGAGSRGGRGMAGVKRQKKTWILRHRPGHLGKRGFKSLRQRNLVPGERAVNVRDLPRLAAGGKELDLSKLGYSKVLGAGSLDIALTVKAGYFTESAKHKIEQAKGSAVLLGGESGADQDAKGEGKAEKRESG
jgi:large subunit ribosomal protein L15